MKIDFEGRTWEFDWKTLTVKQGIAIHLAHHVTVIEYLDGLAKGDPRALQSAYWLMLQQNGVVKPIADCDFDAVAFAAELTKAIAEEPDDDAEPEPEPVPTSPAATADPPWSGSGYQTAMTQQPREHPYPPQRTAYSPSPSGS